VISEERPALSNTPMLSSRDSRYQVRVLRGRKNTDRQDEMHSWRIDNFGGYGIRKGEIG
jgi:hypothetical protein